MNEAKAKEGLVAKPESLDSSGLSMSQGQTQGLCLAGKESGPCLAEKESDTEEESLDPLLELGIATR